MFARLWSALIKRSQVVRSQLAFHSPLCVCPSLVPSSNYFLSSVCQSNVRRVRTFFTCVCCPSCRTRDAEYMHDANTNRHTHLTRWLCGCTVRPNKMYINTAAWAESIEERCWFGRRRWIVFTSKVIYSDQFSFPIFDVGLRALSSVFCISFCRNDDDVSVPNFWKGNTRRSKAGLCEMFAEKNWLDEWHLLMKMFQTRNGNSSTLV